MVNKISRYGSIKEYITKDGSEIREMIHPQHQDNKKISVAEARIKPGMKTEPHYHKKSEEVYVVMAGKGLLRIEDKRYEIEKGVSIVIMPGQVHGLENTNNEDLVVMCCCAPAYGHADTILV
ncbi:MAG: cupin domain-containing protein [Thermodesulfobacteriota bacterium]